MNLRSFAVPSLNGGGSASPIVTATSSCSADTMPVWAMCTPFTGGPNRQDMILYYEQPDSGAHR